VAFDTIWILGEVWVLKVEVLIHSWNDFYMKKFLITAHCILLLSTGISTPAYAATDGCPETWTIDTSQFPSNELRMAKAKLGPNMILSDAEVQIIEYRGEDGISPKIENLHTLISKDSQGFTLFWRSLLYHYGQSTVQYTQRVEVKGCSPRQFTFLQKVPTGGIGGDYTNSALKIKKMNSKEWADQNTQEFIDFKSPSNFSEYLKKITSEKLSFASKVRPYRTNENFVTPNLLAPPSTQGSGLSGKQSLIPQLLTPECLMFALDDNEKQFNPVVKINQVCKFSWSVQIFKPKSAEEMVNELVIFDEVTPVSYSKSGTSITCIKGKFTKKVSGTNPKCPKGYKIKP